MVLSDHFNIRGNYAIKWNLGGGITLVKKNVWEQKKIIDYLPATLVYLRAIRDPYSFSPV